MSVEINAIALGLLAGYAVIGTGMFICMVCGASKEAQDAATTKELIKADREGLRKKVAAMQVTNQDLVAAREQLEADLKVSHSHLAAAQEKIKEHKDITWFTAKRYVNLSNEYAWWRTLLRELFPSEYAIIVNKLNEQKKAASETLAGKETAGESGTEQTLRSALVSIDAGEGEIVKSDECSDCGCGCACE
jgi:membrane carboxypeptidase/penicillin-binding protein